MAFKINIVSCTTDAQESEEILHTINTNIIEKATKLNSNIFILSYRLSDSNASLAFTVNSVLTVQEFTTFVLFFSYRVWHVKSEF